MSNTEKPEVIHNEAQRKFYIKQKEGNATLYYEYLDKETVDLQHTVVADNIRGRGFGDVLAEAALSFATKNKLKVKLSCSFLVHYALKNSCKNKHKIINL
ncbi:hypothetical protein J437_LFUL014328 [Ladona fulva]|uniref:Protein NATD1 n=1 Tax=Ladona fulva TaxID=123851 RepID=A0A8K0P5N1_LADFU|nr:hypothetical protein J437_LFUL014328 [Ladona fulva]